MKLISFALSITAFGLTLTGLAAQESAGPELRYVKTMYSVNPPAHFRFTYVCNLYPARATKMSSSTFSHGWQEAPLAWNADVPDLTAAEGLLEEAQKGPIERGPDGKPGSITVYDGFPIGNEHAPARIMLSASGEKAVINHSEAASKLVKFLEYNCLKQ